MKKLAIAFTVGAAALMGGSAAYAAENVVKAKPSTAVTQSPTDISSQHRHHHWGHHRHHHRHHWGHHRHHHWGHHRHHHWGHHHHYRPYYRSYGHYAPRPYGYHGPRYYGGGPGITFSFGGGGYRGWY